MAFFHWILAFIGHVGLWCANFNWLHSTALPRWARKSSEGLVLVCLVLPVAFLMFQVVGLFAGFVERITICGDSPAGRFYQVACGWLAIPTICFWILRKVTDRPPAARVSIERSNIRMRHTSEQPLLHGTLARTLGLFPLNEMLMLSSDRITLQLDVPSSLDGLRIAQLSDFHFTGQIDLKFFEQVVAQTNAFEPDLIILSGDLLDKRECLDWIEPVFGALRAKHGVFYVLGNHDLRVRDEGLLRGKLHAAGLIRLGGDWKSIEVNGCRIELAGNELPWFYGAEHLSLSAAAGDSCEEVVPALKILVSHSPDQLSWARPYQFDLMFAGHNHGGQIAFPIVGPIIAPSKYGVRYAAGTFQIGTMVMHVSRGLSGDKPIRWNSPPELGLFTIRSHDT